jgi:glycosyltransferase involved in cell wall biosynthesis
MKSIPDVQSALDTSCTLPLKKPTSPTLAVVIPVHNGGQPFQRCLEAITATCPPPNELVVVADGVTDGSDILAREFGATVLSTSMQSGPAYARNLGARHAQSDLLLFIDADVVVTPDIVRRVTSIFRQHPQISALIGAYDAAPTAPNFLSQYRNLLHHYVHQSAQSEGFTFWCACGAIRRDVFIELGGFDTRYRKPSIEDIELGYRLRRAGHHIRLDNRLQVKHLKEWRVGNMLYTDFFRRALPWTSLILRSKEFTNDLNLGISSRLSVMLVYTLLAALVSAFAFPKMTVAALVGMLLLLGLNAPLYRFFMGARGIRFAVMAIAWHWLYYLYSGLAFVLGVIQYIATDLTQYLSNPSHRPTRY